MEKISNLNYGCLTIGAIPSSYLASMTYEEQLLYLLNKLDKELIPNLNKLIEDFSHYDANFEAIYERLDTLQVEIDLFNTEIENINSNLSSMNIKIEENRYNINLLNNKVNNEISELEERLTEIINNNYDILKQYIDYQDNLLDEKIDNIQIGLINVYDPTTGMIQPLQTTINNLYQLTNKDGLSANEFDNLELTATEFDAYQITAYQFDSAGKNILV